MASRAAAERTPHRGGAARTLAQRENRAGLASCRPTLIVVLVVVVAADPVDDHARLPETPAAQPPRPRLFDFGSTPWTTSRPCSPRPGFWRRCGPRSIYSVGGTALSIGLGLVAALALRGRSGAGRCVRASMLLPYVAPVVAVTFVWQIMLSPQFGIVNASGTDLLGWERADRLPQPARGDAQHPRPHSTVPVALLTVIAFEAWRYFPFAFLFILARLQAVPGELDEAARVDGATPTQRFRHILLPQLGRHRPAHRAALHLDLQQVRRHLPAHRRRRRHRGGSRAGVPATSPPAATSARPRPSRWCWPLLLVVLLVIYFRFFVGREEARRMSRTDGTGSPSAQLPSRPAPSRPKPPQPRVSRPASSGSCAGS